MNPTDGNRGDPVDRLDSWKAIARYLNCDVRTARRWENREGLPVHRHLHERKATVFAWRDEIDEWKASRISEPDRPQSASVPMAFLAGIGSFTVLAALVGFFSFRDTASGEAAPSEKPPVHAVSVAVEKISDRFTLSTQPRISHDRIAWIWFDGSDDEVMLHENGETRQLTDNDITDSNPDVSATRVVWQQGEDCNKIPSSLPYDCEIVWFDGTQITQLTRNESAEGRPRIDGDTVVWSEHDGQDWEIVTWDGAVLTRLTDNALDDIEPDIARRKVIWAGFDGQDHEIFLHDGVLTTQLTDNDLSDRAPTISGTVAAWSRDGTLVYWRAGKVVPVAEPDRLDWAPSASGELVVWNRDFDIYIHDGKSAVRLTASRGRDLLPDIDGQDIVWLGHWAGKPALLKARYFGTETAVSQR